MPDTNVGIQSRRAASEKVIFSFNGNEIVQNGVLALPFCW
jgi:hypothetical protein